MPRVDAAQENPFESSDELAVNAANDAATRTQKLLTILGRLNVVFGVLGTLGSIIVVIGRAMWRRTGTRSAEVAIENAIASGVPFTPYLAFRQFAGVGWGILSVGLLVAGIGLLKQKRFGRSLSIICAWLFMLLQVIERLVTYVLVKIPELRNVMEMPTGIGGPQTAIQMVLTDCGELLLVLTYPIALLILLNRNSVIHAFRN